MERVLTTIKGIFVAIGLAVVDMAGGWDMPLKALLLLIVLDYIGGVLHAAVDKRISSSIGFKGIAKKAYYLILIGAVYALEQATVGTEYGHTALTLFLCVNEVISLMEHGQALGVAIPDGLRAWLDKALGKFGSGEPQ